MTYAEKSTQLAINASVAVMVLMGSPDDVEFVPLKPRQADETWLADLKGRYPGRELRSVGWIGLCGANTVSVLKEHLSAEQVSGLETAFIAYLSVLFGDSFREQLASIEIADLERLWKLQDHRTN